MAKSKRSLSGAVLAPEPEPNPVVHGAPAEPWFELDVAGRRVTFAFAEEKAITEANEGEPAWGVTLIERGLVLFDRSLKKDRSSLATILLHELVHVGLGAAIGGTPVADVVLNAPAKDREEAIASYLAQHLAGAMVGGGLLRLPKVPK